ncbi:MAG: InlB B-repeat-containing protein [Chitinispirillia bacterium]|nr:InlB B-repeat-containing protein [Chitinispirillia bacterium]MCL2242440.1 InlB B-repeat-containing protein [Chitinispirillia bacterium]
MNANNCIAKKQHTARNSMPALALTIFSAFILAGCGGTVSLPDYTLTLYFAGSLGGGDVFIDPKQESYQKGALVTLSASPKSGYEFERWEGAANGTAISVTITMNSNKEVTARFKRADEIQQKPYYDLTTAVSPAGSGTVGRDPDFSAYVRGTPVTLTATPQIGYTFDRWEGAPVGTPARTSPVTVSVDTALNITAVFRAGW